MPKGHSDIPERMAALEARIIVLERQIAAMNDSFSRGNIPAPQYEQQFKVWPGANPQSNGA